MAIAVIAAGFYANSFRGQFCLDDGSSIVENRLIQDGGTLKQFLATQRPLFNVTLAANYRLDGLNVRGYHLVNLLIHLACGLLLFGIVRRTLNGPRLAARLGRASLPLAAVAALIWMVHPLTTSAVTYVVQRCESLMAMFYLLTLYAAIRGLSGQGRGRGWLVISVIACAAGIATKQVMVTAPLLVLVYHRIFLAPSWQRVARCWGYYAGLAATWVLLAGLVLSAPASHSAGFEVVNITPVQYAVTQFGVIVRYLHLSFWPDRLCLDYGWKAATTVDQIVPYAVAIAALLAGVVWALIRRPAAGFAGLSFFLILAPTSTFMPIVDVIFEHRMYLPLAALVSLVVILGYLVGQAILRGPVAQKMQVARRLGICRCIAVAAVVVALGVATWLRNCDFYSVVSICQEALGVNPQNARMHNNLGNALVGEGRRQEAVQQYRSAILLAPADPLAYHNYGALLEREGKPELAEPLYRRAIELDPNYRDAHTNLGLLLCRKGAWDEGLQHFAAAARSDPSGKTYVNLASAEMSFGMVEEASRDFCQAIREQPSFSGRVLELLNRALAQQPDSPSTHRLLGLVQAYLHADARAVAHFRQAIALKPGDAKTLNDLAWLLATSGQPSVRNPAEAVTLAAQACQLTQEKDPGMLDTLGAAFASAGKFDQAVAAADQALRLAQESKQSELAKQITERLGLYKAGKPFTATGQ